MTIFLTNIWYVAGLSSDIRAGSVTEMMLCGEPVALGRTKAGDIFALRDVCPHRAVPLSSGRLYPEPDGEVSVECPYHGWRFSTATGKCTSIPSLVASQDMDISRIKARRYPVVERDGLIWIYWPEHKHFDGEPPLDAPAIEAPGHGKPQHVERRVFDTDIDQAVIGLIDPAHGPYVHRQWWWRTEGSLHDKSKHYMPNERGFTMTAHKPSSNSYAYKILGGTPVTEIEFKLPGIRCERIQNDKNKVLNFTAMTPRTKESTEIINVLYWKSGVMSLIKPVVRPLAKAFLDQDARILDLQGSRKAFNPPHIMVDDADTLAKWYLRMVKEWDTAQKEQRDFVNPVEETTLHWRS